MSTIYAPSASERTAARVHNAREAKVRRIVACLRDHRPAGCTDIDLGASLHDAIARGSTDRIALGLIANGAVNRAPSLTTLLVAADRLIAGDPS